MSLIKTSALMYLINSICHTPILSLPTSYYLQKCPLIKPFFSGKSPSSLDNAAKLAWRLLRELLTNGKALENLWKSFREIWRNLWRNQICSRGDQSPVTQKVQLASIFFLGLQAYSFNFRSCTLSLEERLFWTFPADIQEALWTALPFFFWDFFAKKCNTCDHLNCYNLPLNMHQVFDLSKRHLPNISCCFIYHLICL